MKKCRVRIWGNPLICPVCQQDIFCFKKIQTADQGRPAEQEMKYLFECAHCGYGILFGGDRVKENEALMSAQSAQDGI
jgi:hypothetical protein